jgi:UDP-galactose transporter B1
MADSPVAPDLTGKLVFGFFVGVMYLSFVFHFMVHEKLLSGAPELRDFLLFFVCLCNTVAGLIVIKIRRQPINVSPFPYMAIAVPQQLGCYCASIATKFINYPTFQTMKAAKPLSVLLCQALIFRIPPNTTRVLVVIILTIGLIVFGLGGTFSRSSIRGIVLTFLALFFDAVYVPMVDKLKVGQGGAFMTMMFAQMWSALFYGVLTFKSIYVAVIWLMGHPEFMQGLLLFGVTGAIAQLALFAAIERSDGLVVAIATTCRKFCTILLSAILFGHHLKFTQWLGVGIVFTALGIEICFKGKKKVQTEKR